MEKFKQFRDKRRSQASQQQHIVTPGDADGISEIVGVPDAPRDHKPATTKGRNERDVTEHIADMKLKDDTPIVQPQNKPPISQPSSASGQKTQGISVSQAGPSAASTIPSSQQRDEEAVSHAGVRAPFSSASASQPRDQEDSSEQPPAPTAPRGTSSFLDRGIPLAKKAIEADFAGRYQEAYGLYVQALELFVLASKWEKNPQSKTLIQNKAAEYMSRAERLQKFLSGNETAQATQVERPASPTQPSGSADPGASFVDRTEPALKWDIIAGLDDVKEALLEAGELPLKFPRLFTGSRRATTRILLYGPPGTAKKSLVRALAWRAKRTLVVTSSSELASPDIIKALFETAKKNAPSVILIDAFDKFSGQNSSRLCSDVRSQMQNLDTGKIEGVILVASTQRPWDIDETLLPLFEQKLRTGLPEPHDRMQIFRTKITQLRNEEVTCIMGEGDFKKLVELSDGFSGKDIQDSVDAAIRHPLKMIQDATHYKPVLVGELQHFTPCSPGDKGAIEMSWTEVPSDQLLEPPVRIRNFVKAVGEMKPTCSTEVVEKIMRWGY